MIRTRRSFLQRVKESGKQEWSPQKTKEFEWTRSNDDDDRDDAMFSTVDDNDSLMLESTAGSSDDLIVCPPIRSRNSAQDAAEALRQDLEDMGYNLDSKSFITKGTSASDSALIERYQPPRALKPPRRSSSSGAATARSTVSLPPPEKDIIMSMRSMITTTGSMIEAQETKSSDAGGKKNESSGSSSVKADWAVPPEDDVRAMANDISSNNSNSSDGDALTRHNRQGLVGTSRQEEETSKIGKARISDDVSSSMPRSGSEPSPYSYSYGSLKKIASVRAVQSWNDPTIRSSLRERPSSDDNEDEEDIHNKEEQNLTTTSTISKSGHSHPVSNMSYAVPRTLEVPIKPQKKNGDIPKTPVLIEGMTFVKNTTLAPESARNSTLSPRIRHTRSKLRKIIQEKMERNDDVEITSAKTAPAKQMGNFFIEPAKTSRLIVKEDFPVDNVVKMEEVESKSKQEVCDDAVKDIKTKSSSIEADIEETDSNEKVFVDVTPPQLIPIEKSPIAATTESATIIPEAKSDEPMAEKRDDTTPVVSADKKSNSPKKSETLTITPKVPSRQLRPLSLFRWPSLSPRKTRKFVPKEPGPVTKAPKSTTKVLVPEPIKQSADETSKNSDAREDDETTKENCAYVGYEIETGDGVEVVAVAKTLRYVPPASPANSRKTPTPRSSPRPSADNRSEKRADSLLAEIKVLKGGQGKGSLSPRKELVGADHKAQWNIMSFFSNPAPRKEKPTKQPTGDHVVSLESTKKVNRVGGKDHGTDPASRTDEPKNTIVSKKEPSTDSRTTEAATVKRTNHHALFDESKKENKGPVEGTQEAASAESDTKKEVILDIVADTESKQKWKPFRIGFKGFRKTTAVPDVKTKGAPKDRHEIIQDFLDRELKGQEEHSFPSKLDPTKNVEGASFLQDMLIQKAQIPKHLIISRLDDSSCLTTETDKRKASWHEAVASPSVLDASVWDEIADAGVIVERAIEQLEQATKAGDASTKANSALSGDIEKALLTLKKHADRLGVTETDLLLAVKSTDGGESNQKSAQAPTNASTSSYSSGLTPLTYGQDLFDSLKSYLFTK